MYDDPTIWIIDDSEADHALMRLAFEDLLPDESMTSFYSAEKAVEALQQGQKASLVLLDLNMPGQGGLYFLKQRKDRAYMNIPVVILTSSSNPDDIESTYSLGANSYLTKPADLDELMSFAQVVYAYWFKMSHLPRAIA